MLVLHVSYMCMHGQVCACAGAEDVCERGPWLHPVSGGVLHAEGAGRPTRGNHGNWALSRVRNISHTLCYNQFNMSRRKESCMHWCRVLAQPTEEMYDSKFCEPGFSLC